MFNEGAKRECTLSYLALTRADPQLQVDGGGQAAWELRCVISRRTRPPEAGARLEAISAGRSAPGQPAYARISNMIHKVEWKAPSSAPFHQQEVGKNRPFWQPHGSGITGQE